MLPSTTTLAFLVAIIAYALSDIFSRLYRIYVSPPLIGRRWTKRGPPVRVALLGAARHAATAEPQGERREGVGVTGDMLRLWLQRTLWRRRPPPLRAQQPTRLLAVAHEPLRGCQHGERQC